MAQVSCLAPGGGGLHTICQSPCWALMVPPSGVCGACAPTPALAPSASPEAMTAASTPRRGATGRGARRDRRNKLVFVLMWPTNPAKMRLPPAVARRAAGGFLTRGNAAAGALESGAAIMLGGGERDLHAFESKLTPPVTFWPDRARRGNNGSGRSGRISACANPG